MTLKLNVLPFSSTVYVTKTYVFSPGNYYIETPARDDATQIRIYFVLFPVGTAGIILQAPSLYDLRPAIDEYLSEIEVAAKPLGLSDNLYI